MEALVLRRIGMVSLSFRLKRRRITMHNKNGEVVVAEAEGNLVGFTLVYAGSSDVFQSFYGKLDSLEPASQEQWANSLKKVTTSLNKLRTAKLRT